ncbi:MAG TPA: hypothetical protein DDX39_11645 [Bacteroidales bacterium]|nr:MAG: hypothetical protein A2W98_14240 [Bacteroidetes bacterium GWF2_33_38]OFY69336.1 MAG: hypothetical protein A2265_05940 [Bacteroidetes bacterium RIFOXYA12_FULL_33_9]OFY85334.1 MAG: hypothetical protein A2236_06830 [Bacteroidetes bacterium RIFOXYA2_FULL_33_7]HBF89284.1 hypothetical protein [Bacteroidales bacterium]
MSRQIVTLTTDWNHKAYYAGAVKGGLLKICSDITIVDISHNIVPFNIMQTAFILKSSYKHYPENTIHIIGVNSEETTENKLLLIKHENQYFLGADNGVFSLLFDEKSEIIVRLMPESDKFSIFPELEIFPNIVQSIIEGKPIEEIGIIVEAYKEQSNLMPVYNNDSLTGHVIYIDSYNNAITNIKKDFFEKIRKGRDFDILVQSNQHKVSKINNSYFETSNGDILAIFNTIGHLEIGIKNGSASDLLNLEIKSNIRIKFYDH